MSSKKTGDDTISAQARRFFVPIPQELATKLPAELLVTDAQTLHHLTTVCRAKMGERLILTDPQREAAYAATVTDVSRHQVIVSLDDLMPPALNPLPRVTLIAALIKEQRWDPLLQRCTELGVKAIWPVTAERSIVRLDSKEGEKKRIRWQGILQTAAEQSEGLFIPQLASISPSVSALVERLKAEAPEPLKILLMERGPDRSPLKRVLQANAETKRPIFIAIGPEGGWSDSEARAFLSMGFEFASLGERILRSETAAMAAMAAVLYESWDA